MKLISKTLDLREMWRLVGLKIHGYAAKFYLTFCGFVFAMDVG